MKAGVTAFFLLILSTAVCLGNLLSNPGFEQGYISDIPSWTAWNDNTRIESWAHRSGTNGIALRGWTSGGGIHQDVTISGASNYTFSAYGYKDWDFSDDYVVEMKIELYAEDYSLIAVTNQILQGDTSWRKYELSIVTDDQTVYLRAVLSFTGTTGPGGAFKFDDLNLVSKEQFEHFVSKDGSDIPPYSSWETAAHHIGDALAVAIDHSVITVSDGVYQVTSELPVTRDCRLISANGAANTVIDGMDVTRCLRIAHANAIVDGFTITNGHVASTTVPCAGGGIHMTGGTLINCVVSGNQAGQLNITDSQHSMAHGGGIYLNGGLIQDCIISANRASGPTNDGFTSTNAFGKGGGVFITNSGIIANCTIENNLAYGGRGYFHSGEARGGGICAFGPDILISNTIVRNNRAEAGQMYFEMYAAYAYGAGISIAGSTTLVTKVVDCDIYGNTGTGTNGIQQPGHVYGGGIYARAVLIDRCTVSNNTLYAGAGITQTEGGYARGGGIYCHTNADVRNCLMVHNHVEGGDCEGDYAGHGQGGGIFVRGSFMRNSTICDNTAVGGIGSIVSFNGVGEGGGAFLTDGGALHNSIMYFNTSEYSANVNSEGDEYYYVHCCVVPDMGGTGNIGDDPLFVNRAGGNYRLSATSPCINTGSNFDVKSSYDLDSTARITDTVVDMGAYEYNINTLDSDGDYLSDDDEINIYSSDPNDPDSDDDGMLDGHEVLAGTGLNDPSSRLEMTATATPWTPTGITIRWQSVTGKQYDILRSTDLNNEFTRIQTGITATPPQNIYTDTTADAATRYYYRIQLQL